MTAHLLALDESHGSDMVGFNNSLWCSQLWYLLAAVEVDCCVCPVCGKGEMGNARTGSFQVKGYEVWDVLSPAVRCAVLPQWEVLALTGWLKPVFLRPCSFFFRWTPLAVVRKWHWMLWQVSWEPFSLPDHSVCEWATEKISLQPSRFFVVLLFSDVTGVMGYVGQCTKECL